MKYLKVEITIAVIIYFLIIIFQGCKSSKISETDEEGLRIDHLTEVDSSDLQNRIESFEREIRETIQLRDDAVRDLQNSEEYLLIQKQKADSIISDNKKSKINLRNQIKQLEASILQRKEQLQRFKNRNTYQIIIETSQREIANIDRDTQSLRNPNLNEIEYRAIRERYNDIWEETQNAVLGEEDKLSDINNMNENFIRRLLVRRDTLSRRLDKQIDSFEKSIDDFNNKIEYDSIKVIQLGNQIVNLDSGILETKKLIRSLQIHFVNDSSTFKEKINSYNRKETLLLAKRMTHEIALLKKRINLIPNPPQNVIDLLRKTYELHDVLLDNLFEYDFDLMQEQIIVLKDNIESLRWKVEDIENLEGLVKEIFQDRVFTEFLALGDTIPETKPEFRNKIRAFEINIYTIRRFLNHYPRHKIYIDGHADPLRIPINPLYGNKILSKQRAESAKRRLLKAGIPDSNIVVDWFGEFHTLVNPDTSGLPGSPLDRRIDMRIIAPNDISKSAEVYLTFRNNYKIKVGSDSLYFHHQNGFWIENYSKDIYLDTIVIKYKSNVYSRLVDRHPLFRDLIKKKPSPISEKKYLRLGNEIKLVLTIEKKNYWIIIREEGAESVEDPRVAVISSFLKMNK